MPKMTSGVHTGLSLAAIKERLTAVADKLQNLIGLMKDHKFEELLIWYHTEAQRGIDRMERFTESGFEALRKARSERGDFGTEGRTGKLPASLPANGQKLPAKESIHVDSSKSKSRVKTPRKRG